MSEIEIIKSIPGETPEEIARLKLINLNFQRLKDFELVIDAGNSTNTVESFQVIDGGNANG
jgi:hypothetical protein